ncbi:MAG: Crp/Fnr family transcriptional regulator [Cytophagales bacterium]|nr:Crp/Fnr family transcriptional regulator [Cytophagales bacterium]
MIGVDHPDLNHIVSKFEGRKTKRNEILQKSGEVSRYVFFVNKGCGRTYYIQPDGGESTRYIAIEGDFFSSLSSFITQQPTLEFVQAIEPSELLMISRNNFTELLNTSLAFEKIYRQSMEYAYLLTTWRLESFITRDAKARYEFLLQTDPDLVLRLSNKIVASYLGISQETLSRLKSKI